MFPGFENTELLAGWLVGTVAKYLGAAGKNLLEKAGDAAQKGLVEGLGKKAKLLLSKFRSLPKTDEHAVKVLDDFSVNSDDPRLQRRLKTEVENLLEDNPEELKEIRSLVDAIREDGKRLASRNIQNNYAPQTTGDVSGGSSVNQIQGNGNSSSHQN